MIRPFRGFPNHHHNTTVIRHRRSGAALCLLAAMAALVLFTTPAAAASRELCLLPASVVQGLAAVLDNVGGRGSIAFDPAQIEPVLEFVASDQPENRLYHAGDSFSETSAYHRFEVDLDLERLLRFAYNPEIPSYALTPSSVRLSQWKTVSGDSARFPELWRHLSDLDAPKVFRGIEHVVNTPDQFSGTYFAYDLYRTLVLMRYRGQPVLISLSKQTDVSDIGKKGVVLGPDDNWAYLYSGQNGLSRPGLGWVKSYMYDSYSVNIYMQTSDNPGLVRCGAFKWLRAGWSSINLVTPEHIHSGLERYASGLTCIVHHPNLPSSDVMAGVFSQINQIRVGELRQWFERYLSQIESDFGQTAAFPRKWFSEWFRSRQYLTAQGEEELRAVLVIEYIRQLMGKPPCIDLSELIRKRGDLPG